MKISGQIKKLSYVIVFALFAFFVFNSNRSDQSKTVASPMPAQTFDPSQGIVMAMPFIMELDTFLYNAAMSAQFGSVYSLRTIQKESSPGKNETVDIIRKYTRLDDFKKCVEKSSPKRNWTADKDWYSDIRIHQPRSHIAQLLSGTCVEAPMQDNHQARYKLSSEKGFISIEDLKSGHIHRTPIRFLRDERIWALFGLQPHTIPAYTNRIDPQQADNLSLEQIERALNGNLETQLAVLELIGDRLQAKRNAGFQVKLIEVRPTDPKVADLLIESDVFNSNDRRIRQFALRAAATMPSQRDKLFPHILVALKNLITPKPLTVEETKEKARIEQNPRGYDEVLRNNRYLFEEKSPLPGYVFPELVSAAGFATTQFGRQYNDVLINLVPEHILSKLGWGEPGAKYDRGTLTYYNNTGLYLAFINSSHAEQRALKMLERMPNNKITRGRNALEAFLATMPDMPISVEHLMLEKCENTLAGNPSQISPLFCNSMLARRGDHNALKAIHSAMKNGNKQTRQLAARVLLLDHGADGISILKKGLFEGDPVRNGMICHLGVKAGQDVVQYVRSLAQASPDNAQLQRLNNWCQRPMPTMLGLFAG